MGNCYWIRDTMTHYGDMPPLRQLLRSDSVWCWDFISACSGWAGLVQRTTGSTRMALAFAPFLWTALELAGARITSVPWDQLGYSQVDNALVNQLAPFTGVYGISFILVTANALLAGGLLLDREIKTRSPAVGHGSVAEDPVVPGFRRFSLCLPSRIPLRPPFWFSRISMWATTIAGRGPANGTAISPSSRALPAKSAKRSLRGFRRLGRRRTKSSARLIPRIPILSRGRNHPRPSTTVPVSTGDAVIATTNTRRSLSAASAGPMRMKGTNGTITTRQSSSVRPMACWPLRQNPPRPFRRIHSVSGSA